jgi:vancomycin resistance protein YoaR
VKKKIAVFCCLFIMAFSTFLIYDHFYKVKYDVCLSQSAYTYENLFNDINIHFYYQDKNWYYKNENVKKSKLFEINGKKELKEMLISKSGVLPVVNQLLNMGLSMEQASNYIFNGIGYYINSICKSIEKEPINASVEFKPENKNMFSITKGKSGLKLNKDKFYYDFLLALCHNEKIDIELPFENIEPKITSDMLYSSTYLRSKEKTSYIGGVSGRIANLRLALSRINGTILMPNETLSFNKIVKLRTEANGYQTAKVISNGEFVDGIGGGVCQASTLTYNGALMAGLDIVQVRNHTLPVHYVEPAFDAMVNETGSDLKFRNNTTGPIFIKTYNVDESSYIEIYGQSMGNIHYNKISEKIREIESKEDNVIIDINGEYLNFVKYKDEIYRKKPRINGYVVKGYLQKFDGDKLLSTELVRLCTYNAQKGILIQGSKEREKEKIISPFLNFFNTILQ